MAASRVVVDPAILAGKPVIRGTRIPVHLIVGLLGMGEGVEGILAEYPQLTREDVAAAAEFASRVLEAGDLDEYGDAGS